MFDDNASITCAKPNVYDRGHSVSNVTTTLVEGGGAILRGYDTHGCLMTRGNEESMASIKDRVLILCHSAGRLSNRARCRIVVGFD